MPSLAPWGGAQPSVKAGRNKALPGLAMICSIMVGVRSIIKCHGGPAVLNARDSHPGVPADPWPGLSESDLQQFAEIVA